jgi:ribonuclease T2
LLPLGGQFAATQFWDTSPSTGNIPSHREPFLVTLTERSTGPSNSWTVHGLWPDHCDGTYDSSCDTSRAYTGIGSILTSLGKSSLLSYMNTYWKDVNGDDESFWEHEWGKHGTCVSTLNPSCYNGYTSKQEVGDYFQKAVDIFKTRDTYGVSTEQPI